MADLSKEDFKKLEKFLSGVFNNTGETVRHLKERGKFEKVDERQINETFKLVQELKKFKGYTETQQKLAILIKNSSEARNKEAEEIQKQRLSNEGNWKAFLRQNNAWNIFFNVTSKDFFSNFNNNLKTFFSKDKMKFTFGAVAGLSSAGLLGDFGPKITEGLKGFREFRKERDKVKADVDYDIELQSIIKQLDIDGKTLKEMNDYLRLMGVSSDRINNSLTLYQRELKKTSENIFRNGETEEEIKEALIKANSYNFDVDKKEDGKSSSDDVSIKEPHAVFEESITVKKIGSGNEGCCEILSDILLVTKSSNDYLEVMAYESMETNELSKKKMEQDQENWLWDQEHKKDGDKEKETGLFENLFSGFKDIFKTALGTMLGGMSGATLASALSAVIGPLAVVAIGTALTTLAYNLSKQYADHLNSKENVEKQTADDKKKYEERWLEGDKKKLADKYEYKGENTNKAFDEWFEARGRAKLGIEPKVLDTTPSKEIAKLDKENREEIKKQTAQEKAISERTVATKKQETPVVNVNVGGNQTPTIFNIKSYAGEDWPTGLANLSHT